MLGFDDVEDDFVGLALQGGEFFVAAQVVLFGQLGRCGAVLAAGFHQLAFQLAGFGFAQLARCQPFLQAHAFFLQGGELFLLRAELALQAGFDFFGGLRFAVEPGGVDVADFFEIGVRAADQAAGGQRRQQQSAQTGGLHKNS